MRKLSGAAAILALAACLGDAKADAGASVVYIGSRGSGEQQGIYAATLDPETGHLTGLGLAASIKRPNWLAKGLIPGLLYSAADDGQGEGSVVALSADGKGHLRETGRVGSGGGGPTHLALDPPSRTLFVANYGGGQLAALPIGPDGALAASASTQTDQGSGPSPRQKGPHAHEAVIDPSRHFVLVTDLGADRVFLYRFDAASRKLQPAEPAYEPLPPGSGPRHLVFYPGGKWAFLITELSAELKTYRWDGKKGELTLTGTVSTLAPDYQGKKSGAEIALSSDGRFLYLSNRGEDTIVVFAVDGKTGSVTEIQRVSCGGKDPWGFAFARGERWMLVANEASGEVSVLERDLTNGKLLPTQESLTVPNPVSLLVTR
jgi:6-phosphogluconolactonase